MHPARDNPVRERSPLSVVGILGGLLLAMGVTLCGSILIGIVVSLSDWQDFPRSIQGFNYVSIAVGGLYAARRAGRLGWLNGGLVGVLYVLCLAILVQRDWTLQSVLQPGGMLRLGLSFLAGATGGILGVNF